MPTAGQLKQAGIMCWYVVHGDASPGENWLIARLDSMIILANAVWAICANPLARPLHTRCTPLARKAPPHLCTQLVPHAPLVVEWRAELQAQPAARPAYYLDGASCLAASIRASVLLQNQSASSITRLLQPSSGPIVSICF